MRTALRVGPSLLASMIVLVVLLAVKPLPATRSIAIWIVLVTAIALRELVRSLDRRHELKSNFEAALRQRRGSALEASPFAAMERELELATSTAEHAHRRLLPLLRAAAAARLGMRHGIELERRPDIARRLLGEQAWDLLRPDRPEPAERHGPGPGRDEIAAVVARIEAL